MKQNNTLHCTNNSAFVFFQQQAEKLKTLGRIRSSEMLRSSLNRLREFREGKDFSLSVFNNDMVEGFDAYLKTRGLKRNTISFYMRNLRTHYNLAVEYGMTRDKKPFRRVFTGNDKTEKRALTFEEIKAIKDLDLSAKPHLDFARDMLLFSFYARGMSFIDMAYLRKSDLHGNHFTYSRKKTGQSLTVEWIQLMENILMKYGSNKTDFLLPIITDPNKDERSQYFNQIIRINRNLKTIGRLANISGSCTLYRSRHGWATLARDKQVPLSVISKALGHDNERTTQIYLDSIRSSVVDVVNRQLLSDL